MAGWWGDKEFVGSLFERVTGWKNALDCGAAYEGRQEVTDVWDVCAWDFRSLRIIWGGCRDGRERIWSVVQICVVVP